MAKSGGLNRYGPIDVCLNAWPTGYMVLLGSVALGVTFWKKNVSLKTLRRRTQGEVTWIFLGRRIEYIWPMELGKVRMATEQIRQGVGEPK